MSAAKKKPFISAGARRRRGRGVGGGQDSDIAETKEDNLEGATCAVVLLSILL